MKIVFLFKFQFDMFLLQTLLWSVAAVPVDSQPASVQVMAWCRTGGILLWQATTWTNDNPIHWWILCVSSLIFLFHHGFMIKEIWPALSKFAVSYCWHFGHVGNPLSFSHATWPIITYTGSHFISVIFFFFINTTIQSSSKLNQGPTSQAIFLKRNWSSIVITCHHYSIAYWQT